MTVRNLVGDVRDRLAELPDQSVQCVVTSPPYMGLRDYGTAQWDGGDPGCDHSYFKGGNGQASAKQVTSRGTQSYQYAVECPKCGAVRIDRQIGLEPTLAEYVETLVQVFRDVRRVLRDDGTLWLNLGDSYASAWPCSRRNIIGTGSLENGKRENRPPRMPDGLKEKDLMMVPARVALALQDDGWYLRSDVIWHKPNPMPESVTDRPTSAHEHIFLLTKSARYFYDADAIREGASSPPSAFRNGRSYVDQGGAPDNSTHKGGIYTGEFDLSSRNSRNVWTIATAPYKEAHFATFPPELPRRCILAGTSENGACPACGAPWVRCVKRTPMVIRRGPRAGMYGSNTTDGLTGTMLAPATSKTTGWQPSCTCNAGDPVPCVVLDPFAGAGTTLLVADQLGRDAVGIELNPEYAALIERRLREDAPMFAEVVTAPMLAQGVLL